MMVEVSGYHVLGGLFVGATLLMLISRLLERRSRSEQSFSLSKEIEKFRKERARRRKEEKVSGEELAEAYILAAINQTDLETVERIVREYKKKIKEREEMEKRNREAWESAMEDWDRRLDVGWYTTVNPYRVGGE